MKTLFSRLKLVWASTWNARPHCLYTWKPVINNAINGIKVMKLVNLVSTVQDGPKYRKSV